MSGIMSGFLMQVLAPAVQDGHQPDLGAEVPGIAAARHCGHARRSHNPYPVLRALGATRPEQPTSMDIRKTRFSAWSS